MKKITVLTAILSVLAINAVYASEPVNLNKSAAAYIAAEATEGSMLGPIDNLGTLGLSAYRLTPAAANQLVATVKKELPGLAANVNGRSYSENGPSMVVVVGSDGEAEIYMYEQNDQTGVMEFIANFNTTDIQVEWDLVMNELVGGLNGEYNGAQLSAPIDIGGGCEYYWWTK